MRNLSNAIDVIISLSFRQGIYLYLVFVFFCFFFVMWNLCIEKKEKNSPTFSRLSRVWNIWLAGTMAFD